MTLLSRAWVVSPRRDEGRREAAYLEVTAAEDALGVNDHEAYPPLLDVRVIDLEPMPLVPRLQDPTTLTRATATYLDVHPLLLLQSLQLAKQPFLRHIGLRLPVGLLGRVFVASSGYRSRTGVAGSRVRNSTESRSKRFQGRGDLPFGFLSRGVSKSMATERKGAGPRRILKITRTRTDAQNKDPIPTNCFTSGSKEAQ